MNFRNIVSLVWEQIMVYFKWIPWKNQKSLPALPPVQTIGIITQIEGSFGLINGNQVFEIDEENYELEVGDTVTYERDPDSFAKNIIRVTDHETDKKCLEKIIGEIIERRGTVYTVSPGSKQFDLDEVSIHFTPRIGDCIVLKNEEDSSYQKTVTVVPFKQMKTLGVVTSLNEFGGIINKNIRFTFNDCECGFKPSLGEKVISDNIKTSDTLYQWRAILVNPKNMLNLTLKRFRQNVEAKWFQHGVALETVEEMTLHLGDHDKLTVCMLNQGCQAQIFKCLKIVGEFSFVNLITKLSSFVLEPKMFAYFEFEITAKQLGVSKFIVDWEFENFILTTIVRLEIILPDSEISQICIDSCAQITTYKNAGQKGVFCDTKVVTIPGCRPFKPAHFIPVQIGMFPIPADLLVALKNSRTWTVNDQMLHISSIRSCLQLDLYKDNFKSTYHTLLYLEEFSVLQKEEELIIPLGTLKRVGEFIVLENLNEMYKILSVGDAVYVKEINTGSSVSTNDTNEAYEGFIHNIKNLELYIKFHPCFHQKQLLKKLFLISFKISRMGFRRRHHAVNLAYENLGNGWLFPSRLNLKPPQIVIIAEKERPMEIVMQNKFNNFSWNSDGRGYGKRREKKGPMQCNYKINKPMIIQWFTKDLNHEQKSCCESILKGVCRPLPYIIYGPPGTGKTVTLVEVIIQLAVMIPESRILVAAPSNSAVDIICLRLLHSGIKTCNLIRLTSYSYLREDRLPALLMQISAAPSINKTYERGDDDLRRVSREEISRYKIVVGTLGTVGILYNMGFPRGSFTHVLIDEAGQTTEPDVLIPLGLINPHNGQVILAGDPMQLGPVITSKLATSFGLNRSLLQRLFNRYPYAKNQELHPDTLGFDNRLITKLIRNYRSVPMLVHLTSEMFYSNELIPQICGRNSPEAHVLSTLKEILPVQNGNVIPYVFIDVRGIEEQEEGSTSTYNTFEVMQIANCIMKLYSKGRKMEEIGIITPYLLQVKKIIAVLEKLGLEVPKLGSVEEFQGQEKDIIILSLVKSNLNNSQFIACFNRINVALSRAKSVVIVIGNNVLLENIPKWKYYIDQCKESGSYLVTLK